MSRKRSREEGTSKCLRCGEVFQLYSRHSMFNHERTCEGELERVSSDDGSDDGSADGSDDDDVSMLNVDDDVNPVIAGGASRPVPCPHVTGFDDFGHLTQFLGMGRFRCSQAERQVIEFVHMNQRGYGVSRSFSEGLLKYSKDAGGKNMHLPDCWKTCVQFTSGCIDALQGKRKTFHMDVPIPENVRELLADRRQTHIAFEFECPILEMVRVAMFSQTCQNMDNVALSYEDNDGHLDDFCNGDRYKRIAADMSPGGAILGAVLATDGICLDKCMFDSQEVGVWCLHCVLTGL
jgi:hypothetical protein